MSDPLTILEPMTILHHTTIRRFVAILFLLSSLSVQAQTLFACNLMDEAPKAECCCEDQMKSGCDMGGSCDFSNGLAVGNCCDVTVDIDTQDGVVVSSTEARLVTQLDAPQPPPTLAPEVNIVIALTELTSLPRFQYSTTSWSAGTHTYFLTNRFRI